jgi:hypothetical protein
MHWSRVIREKDNPEWTGVVHADNTLSEVKVGVFADEIHIHINPGPGKRVLIHDGFADR